MAKATQTFAVGAGMVAALLAADLVDAVQAQTPTQLDRPDAPKFERVRTSDPVLYVLIQRATSRSPTFRDIVEAIQATKSVVYVERGRCGHSVRACLALWIALAGENRILQVFLADTKQEDEAMASIAHELTHALEVLREPSVRTVPEMYLFFRRTKSLEQGQALETRAALDAGNAVFKELKQNRIATTR